MPKALVRPLAATVGLLQAVSLGGCMASIATHVEEPVPLEQTPDVAVLAVMPGAVEAGSEWVRPRAMARLVEALRERLPNTVVIGPDEAAHRLAEQSLARDYASLLDDFRDAGVIDPVRLEVLTAAVGATHLLTTRTAYEGESIQRSTSSFDGSPLVYDTKRQSLYVVARLWEPNHHAPTWEAVVRSRSQAGFFGRDRPPLEVVDALIVGLAERLAVSIDPVRSTAVGQPSAPYGWR